MKTVMSYAYISFLIIALLLSVAALSLKLAKPCAMYSVEEYCFLECKKSANMAHCERRCAVLREDRCKK